ncbi:hypothetical protein [Streptomyces griseorubiginosus]|uniref:hypothetical protein n=1 Tax=Streptomyces griseorubiginosus TaxID=67304 RepID=UPI00364CF57A
MRITLEDEPLPAALERDGRAGCPELRRATALTESAAGRRPGTPASPTRRR